MFAARNKPREQTRRVLYNVSMKQLLLLVTLLGLAACAAPRKSRLVGADRDAHGCIGSAGYVWNETLHQCARPWEVNN